MDKRKIILSPDFWISLSAPAGSGKTYWLSRRFMEIIKEEKISPLKILAITFTEKAAGEMKMRILNMAKSEYPEIYEEYEEEFMMLRISTIHSFCNSFLRRFGNEIGIPLGFEILSSTDAKLYFEEKINEFIVSEIFRKEREYEWILGASAFFKWTRFMDVFKNFYNKRPLTDKMFYRLKNIRDITSRIPSEFVEIKEVIEEVKKELADKTIPDYRTLMEKPEEIYKILKVKEKFKQKISDRTLRNKFFKVLYDLFFFHLTFIFSIFFKEILDYYVKVKSFEAKVDFSDMEFFAYQILNEGKIEEIENVLEAFDERTSHILIDEFQDTNFLQWSIIEKLTEEWRSGWGAKYEKGEKTSLFIVGDPMQSIYMFRNANVRTFKKAEREIGLWLGERAKIESLKDNYRSLSSIIDFVNKIFQKDRTLDYVPFVKKRNNQDTGFVEIIIEESRVVESEVRAVARKIKSLIGREIVYEKKTEKKKKCDYGDIAILLRKRTNLNIYEKIFKEEKIPYCIVGGIGFWSEPEIELLVNFFEFLVEPSYTKGLYLALKSPLFGLKEEEILDFRIRGRRLWDGLDNKIKEEIDSLKKDMLNRGVSNSFTDYLINKGFFKYLGSDIQRVKNVLKFLKIIYYLEKKGKTLFEIVLELRRFENVESEPRANIFSEGMNAVRILTIHRAKGLEFPIVFVPELDSIKTIKQDVFAFNEDERGYMFKIYPFEKGNIEFKFYKEYIERLRQEEKRILYVALTRARDGLVISGKFNFKKNPSSLSNAFQYVLNKAGIIKEGETYKTEEVFENLKIIKSDDIEDRLPSEQEKQSEKQRIIFEREIYIPEKIVYKSMGDYYAIIFGEVVHTVFDAISRNLIEEDKIYRFAENLLLRKKVDEEMRENFIEELKNQIEILKQKGIWDRVILPKEDSFSEIEFIYEEKGVTGKGRIDRLILKQNSAELYDYKISLKAQDKNIKEKIIRESIAQIQNYMKAVKEYFEVNNISSFLIFTKDGEMIGV